MVEEGFSLTIGKTKIKAPVFIAVGLFIVIILFLSFSGSDSSVTGGAVATDASIEEVSVTEEVIVVEDNSEQLAALQTELTSCQSTLVELQSSERALKPYWEAQLEKEKIKYDQQMEIKEEQLEEALTTNWLTIENAADSICCKEKVDNSNIDSFKIVNDMIECTEGSGQAIEC